METLIFSHIKTVYFTCGEKGISSSILISLIPERIKLSIKNSILISNLFAFGKKMLKRSTKTKFKKIIHLIVINS